MFAVNFICIYNDFTAPIVTDTAFDSQTWSESSTLGQGVMNRLRCDLENVKFGHFAK